MKLSHPTNREQWWSSGRLEEVKTQEGEHQLTPWWLNNNNNNNNKRKIIIVLKTVYNLRYIEIP